MVGLLEVWTNNFSNRLFMKEFHRFRPALTVRRTILSLLFPVALFAGERGIPRDFDTPVDPSGQPTSEDQTEALAKLAQNPVGNLISLPIQWNLGFGAGPDPTYVSTLNIQPVVPISITEDWNIITRTIVPILSVPTARADTHVAGIGDVNFTAFLSPAKGGKFIWGVGPSFLFPTASSPQLGGGKWGLGPSVVALYIEKQIVAGALVSNVWSYAGWGDRDINSMTLQPFFNYNLPRGWYLTTSPIITANWEAEVEDRWTVPVGGGVGKIVHLGKLPLNVTAQAYYNVVTPEFGPDWSIRLQCQFLFPK